MIFVIGYGARRTFNQTEITTPDKAYLIYAEGWMSLDLLKRQEKSYNWMLARNKAEIQTIF